MSVLALRPVAVALILIAILLAGTAPAAEAAKKKRGRTMELSYTEPAAGKAGVGVCFQGSSCLFFGPPTGKEHHFAVKIEDDTGLPVNASVIQDTNGDGNFLAGDDLAVEICGETTDPIEVEPGKPVSVWVWHGPGVTPPCPGTASAGTATATFSK